MKLKLSDAIVLGDSLKKGEPNKWLSPDGSCGCAFGGALLAAGVKVERFIAEEDRLYTAGGLQELPCIKELWPYLRWINLRVISDMYYAVAKGQKTIFDIAAYVRTVEPPEDDEQQETELPAEQAVGVL